MSTATQPRERPVLFSGEMVRAILDGTKRQTRRVVKPQPLEPHVTVEEGQVWAESDASGGWYATPCPYGQPGDLLYVRETFSLNHSGHVSHRGVLYQATALTDQSHHGKWASCRDGEWFDFYDRPMKGTERRWRPSIHMPKWAARIWLRITAVRVERVQDGGDREFWGEEVWQANPWVWVIEFERAEAPGGAS
jgi:hypothetical protein